MVTQLKIDEKLLDKALDLSNHSTVNLLIEEALLEYIQRREQLKVLDLFCTIDYEEDYDYKEKRKVR
ncbi:MAG: type II toxin-antitoxin system VapB family antitoxin [Hormoscilla sp. SP12CHS1]|nr:type II toxin-antitoxin system VapB family antitoxin [Hormoscilla sp. SP12CHS1]